MVDRCASRHVRVTSVAADANLFANFTGDVWVVVDDQRVHWEDCARCRRVGCSRGISFKVADDVDGFLCNVPGPVVLPAVVGFGGFGPTFKWMY